MPDDIRGGFDVVPNTNAPETQDSTVFDTWYQNQTQAPDPRLIAILEEAAVILDRLKSLDSRHEQAISDLESRISVWTSLEAGLRVRTRALDELYENAVQSSTGIQTQARLGPFDAGTSTGSESAHGPESQGPMLPPSGGATQPSEPWQLEGVLSLHDELRRSEGALGLPPAREEAPQLLAARVESLELAAVVGKEELQRTIERYSKQRRSANIAIVFLAAGIVATAMTALNWKRGLDARLLESSARLADAQKTAQSAVLEAEKGIAAAKVAAEQQVVEARRTAQRAQIVSDVLAAPDLVRVHLPGSARAPQASAQLLFSRSRGFVLSGARLPAPRDGSQLHLWALTRGRPVGLGGFSADGQGQVTWANDAAPRTPSEVTGAAITVEAAGSAPRRSEATLRGRALAVSAPPQPDPVAIPTTSPLVVDPAAAPGR